VDGERNRERESLKGEVKGIGEIFFKKKKVTGEGETTEEGLNKKTREIGRQWED